MEFKKYPHLERLGNDEVKGIEFGECWIFPKLDGANAQLFFKYYEKRNVNDLGFGSRNRDLGGFGGNDNQGMLEKFLHDDIYRIKHIRFFDKYTLHRP